VVEATVSAAGIRLRLVAVWLLLGVLVGVIMAIEYIDLAGTTIGQTGMADPRLLLPVSVDRLGAFEVAKAGRLHRFERDAAGAWFYHGVHAGSEGAHAHPADLAAAQRIERALAAFGRTRIERRLALDRDGREYGVTPPRLVVLIYLSGESQPLNQYAVGDIAPDTVSRYVQVVGQPSVVTIPDYQIENLLGLIGTLEGVAAGGASSGGSGTTGATAGPAATGLASRGPAGSR
jgi:hypothetical protein